jgi:CBS domain-containing protein
MRTAAAMTRDVVVVSADLPVRAARRIMERHRIRHLPVVRNDRLVGILSDRDLLRYEGLDLEGVDARVGEAMTLAPITCSVDTGVSRVAEIMIQHKIDSVPVVNAVGGLVGLVTSSDLLLLLVEGAHSQPLPFDYRLHLREEDGMAADGE